MASRRLAGTPSKVDTPPMAKQRTDKASTPTANPVLGLQRRIGNRAVVELLDGRFASIGQEAHALQRGSAAIGRVVQRDDSEDSETSGGTTTTNETGLGKETPEHVKTGKDRRKEVETGRGTAGSGLSREEGREFGLWVFSVGAEIEEAGLDTDPLKASEIIGSKFPKGPGMTEAQYQLVERFSDSEHGRRWLDEAGLYTVPRAEAYLREHKYQAWLRLDAANRILLAYLAWRRRDEIGLDVVEGTPPYRLGRSMDGKDRSLTRGRRRKYEKEIDTDIKNEWVKTLKQPEGEQLSEAREGIAQGGATRITGLTKKTAKVKTLTESEVLRNHATATAILERILLLLHHGLQVYDKDSGQHEDYTGSVARALSHGGRVTVRVPQIVDNKDQNRLMEWLGVMTGSKVRSKTGVFTRAFGTHHQAIGENEKDEEGNFIPGTGRFREQGGAGAALKSFGGSTKLYGVNLSVGGLGNKDFNGDVILPDGAHGHLLLVWRPPTTTRDGALQIGVETTAPHAKSTVGYIHDKSSSEATANPESSFGGMKSDKVGEGGADPLKLTGKSKGDGLEDEETNARLVDLTKMGDDWLANLNQLEEQFAILKERVDDAHELLVGGKAPLREALSEPG